MEHGAEGLQYLTADDLQAHPDIEGRIVRVRVRVRVGVGVRVRVRVRVRGAPTDRQ